MTFAIVVHLVLEPYACNKFHTLYFYDLTTLTYNELEHVQSKQHVAYLGVVNRRGQTKEQLVTFVALIKCFEVKFIVIF